MALAAIAEDGDLAQRESEVDIAGLDHFGHRGSFRYETVAAWWSELNAGSAGEGRSDRCARARGTPWGRTSSSNASSSSGTADDLERERVAADVSDTRAEHLTERDQLGPLVGRRADGDQRELALDRLPRPVAPSRASRSRVCGSASRSAGTSARSSRRAEREPRDVRPFGRPHREALDVVAAWREDLRRRAPALPACFPARLRWCAYHVAIFRLFFFASSGSSITSTDAAPAGTIG